MSIDVVRDYLIKEKSYKKPFSEMTAREIDDEIQDGIAQCEVSLRKLIKDVLYVQLPRVDAPEFMRLDGFCCLIGIVSVSIMRFPLVCERQLTKRNAIFS